MRIEDAIKVLGDHNKWRRYDGPIGEGPKATDPKVLGEAIDTVVDAFKNYADGYIQMDFSDPGDIYNRRLSANQTQLNAALLKVEPGEVKIIVVK